MKSKSKHRFDSQIIFETETETGNRNIRKNIQEINLKLKQEIAKTFIQF